MKKAGRMLGIPRRIVITCIPVSLRRQRRNAPTLNASQPHHSGETPDFKAALAISRDALDRAGSTLINRGWALRHFVATIHDTARYFSSEPWNTVWEWIATRYEPDGKSATLTTNLTNEKASIATNQNREQSSRFNFISTVIIVQIIRYISQFLWKWDIG